MKRSITIAGERGATLIGQLAALAVMGIAVMILLSGLSSGSRGISIVQERVTASNYARHQMEAIKAAAYRANPTIQPYPMVPAPGIYTATVAVSYWVSPTFQGTVPATDEGLQFITVTVESTMDPGTDLFNLEDYKSDRR